MIAGQSPSVRPHTVGGTCSCGWVVVLMLMCVGRQATPTTIQSGALRLAMTTETSSCSTCGALRGTACMGVVGCLGSRSGCTSTNTMRWETNVGNGVVGLEFDRKDIEMNKLVVSTLESKFRVYNMRTQHPEKGFSFLSEKAHKSTVWLGRHLPQNRDLFMTAGGNGGINLYR